MHRTSSLPFCFMNAAVAFSIVLVASAVVGGCGGFDGFLGPDTDADLLDAHSDPAADSDAGHKSDGSTKPDVAQDVFDDHAQDGVTDDVTDARDDDQATDSLLSDVEDAPSDVPFDADASGPLGPSDKFHRYCTTPWKDTLKNDTCNHLTGAYIGYYDKLPVGTQLVMNLVADHAFRVNSLRAVFIGKGGEVRIRLTKSFGGSYPDLDGPGADILPPQKLVVEENTDASKWVSVDVSEHGVMLEPKQHYALVAESLDNKSFLAVEELPVGQTSRALMIVPGESIPYGSDGNFRLQLGGETFCQWTDSMFWFAESQGQPFATTAAQYGGFADINSDGNVDLVLNEGAPTAFFGDGKGGFSVPSNYPFPDTPMHTLLVFADINNDGHVDAFAGANVSPDRDGDGFKLEDGDCDDADSKVNPGATEVADNGKDDDCDGVVDDGMDTTDRDSDGVTVAGGDCDDTRNDVFPGADEKLDGRDNDCDGLVDEDFVNRILMNDGKGVLRAKPVAAVQVLDPTAAAAFGDGNGDGKLDLYWGNWLVHYPDPAAVADVYMMGNGDGTFTNESMASGIGATRLPCYGVAWNDFDNNGYQDIWVGNYGYSRNLLWNNDGTGKFKDVASAKGVARDGIGFQGGNTFGGDFGDIDNDGDLDLFAANIAHPRYQPESDISMLLINQGPPEFKFTEERQVRGIAYDEGDVNGAFADFDNDGDLDLAVASLYPGHFSKLYENDGKGYFTDVSYQANVAVENAVTVAWADVDHDGDLDLLVVDRAGQNRAHLFINRVGSKNSWITLDLQGTTTNRGGIGARVTVKAGGVTQMREVRAGGGHNVQSDRIVHFGLGSSATIDEVKVAWVGGSTETISGITPRGRFRVVQGTGTGVQLP